MVICKTGSKKSRFLENEDFWSGEWRVLEWSFFKTNSRAGNVALRKGGISGAKGKGWFKPRKPCLGARYILKLMGKIGLISGVFSGISLTIEDLSMSIAIVEKA